MTFEDFCKGLDYLGYERYVCTIQQFHLEKNNGYWIILNTYDPLNIVKWKVIERPEDVKWLSKMIKRRVLEELIQERVGIDLMM